jgi:hypothetical protein
MAIALQTKFIKNGSETVVTFIGTETRDGIERARFQASHGGIVSLTMTTFLERYSEYVESVEPEPELTRAQLRFKECGYELASDGRILNEYGHCDNCLEDLIPAYLEDFPIPSPEFAFGDDIQDVFVNHRPGSCMGYDNDECHEMRQVYANNPDVVCLAFFRPGSHYLLCGSLSCLVWRTSTKIWIDKIYNGGFRTYHFETTMREHIIRCCLGKWPGLVLEKPDYINLSHDTEQPLPFIDTFYHAEDIGGGEIRLWSRSTGNTTASRSTSGTILAEQCVCCSCNGRLDPDDYRSNNNGDAYCESCWDDNYAYDEISDSYVDASDMSRFEVYFQGRIRTLYTTSDSLYDNFSQCADGSLAEYVHDDDRIENINGEYLCPDDMDSGDWVETEDGEIVAIDEAYQWNDGTWHTEEEEEEEEDPDDMPEDDDSDDEPMSTDLIMVRIKCDDGTHSMPATKIGDCLAVHLKYITSSRDAIKWQVSHIPTGLQVYGNMDTKQEAIDAATKLLASLAIGGIANGMLTTVDPNRVDPIAYLASATDSGINDQIVNRIYKNLSRAIDYSVLATV